MQTPRSDLPVLMLIGDKDPTANQRALVAMKRVIPQAQIEVIGEVGHWLMVESKDYIIESIPKFLQAHLPNGVHTKL